MSSFSRISVWIRARTARRTEWSLPVSALSGSTGFVSLDLETTGLNSKTDAIVSAAVVPFVNGVAESPLVDALANPGRPIPVESQRIHGITDDMVRHQPPARRIVLALVDACEGRVVVGHSVAFDLRIIGRYTRSSSSLPLGEAVLDVDRLARSIHPHWGWSSLAQLARRLRVPADGRHTAAGDAVMAGRILLALLPQLTRRGAATVTDLLRLQRRA